MTSCPSEHGEKGEEEVYVQPRVLGEHRELLKHPACSVSCHATTLFVAGTIFTSVRGWRHLHVLTFVCRLIPVPGFRPLRLPRAGCSSAQSVMGSGTFLMTRNTATTSKFAVSVIARLDPDGKVLLGVYTTCIFIV